MAQRLNRISVSLAGALLCVTSAVPFKVVAQKIGSSGSIDGEVLDPQHRALAGAQVTLRATDQPFLRTVNADSSGGFAVPSLPPGNYTVEAKAAGLEMRRPARVALALDAKVHLQLTLGLTPVRQHTEVQAGGRPLQEGNTVPQETNREDAELTTSLAGLTVTYLPSRSRDVTQVEEYAPAVAQLPDGRGWIVAGQRPSGVSASVDGAEFRDAFRGGIRGQSYPLPFFPQTTVREVEIVEAGAAADVGGTSGGFLNIATKSGTNRTRGELFYTGRPSTLGGDDAFGHSLHSQQHLFGGSQGGSLRHDRLFYYAGGEQDIMDVGSFVQFAPQVATLVIPDSLRSREGEVVGSTYSTALAARLDGVLSPTELLTVQLNFNHFRASNLAGGSSRSTATQENLVGLRGEAEWVRLGLTSARGAALVNQATAQWARDAARIRANSTAPELVVNGFGTLGGNALEPQRTVSGRWQIADDVALTRGRSTLHLGGSFADAPAFQDRLENSNGRFDYVSLAAFLAGEPRRYQQAFTTGASSFDASLKFLGAYAVLRQSLAHSLALTAGLRWDAQWNPQPSTQGVVAQARSIPNDLAQWQPRLGFAWSPGKSTTVRASGGLLDAPSPGSYFQRVFAQNGAASFAADSLFDPGLLSIANPSFALSGLPSFVRTNALVYGVAPSFRNPRSLQGSVSVQQTIRATTLSAAYLHASTFALTRVYDRNLFPPSIDTGARPVFPVTRPNQSLGRLMVDEAAAHSSYDGMVLTANFKLPQRSFLSANYTLAHALDDDSNHGPYDRSAVLNPFTPRAERANSLFDVRQNLNINAIVNLPKGFKVNPLLLARSGLPYTPVVGFDLQGDANDGNDRAVLANTVTSRNSMRQPSLYNLDVRFVKDFTLKGEGHHLDLFLDILNATGVGNRNFGSDGISVFGSAAFPVASAGQPLYAPNTTLFGSPRQIQFTARLVGF